MWRNVEREPSLNINRFNIYFFVWTNPILQVISPGYDNFALASDARATGRKDNWLYDLRNIFYFFFNYSWGDPPNVYKTGAIEFFWFLFCKSPVRTYLGSFISFARSFRSLWTIATGRSLFHLNNERTLITTPSAWTINMRLTRFIILFCIASYKTFPHGCWFMSVISM